MSFQQKSIRSNKVMKAYNQYKPSNKQNPWTDGTYLLRNSLWCIDFTTLTLNERQYLDTRWPLIENYLSSKSVAELILKIEISKCSKQLHQLDYIAILIGFLQKSYNGYIFEHEIAIQLIDKYDIFNDALKNSKCMRILLKTLHLAEEINDKQRVEDVKQVIVHILNKFPDMKKQSFMFRKHKGKLIQKISEDDIQKYF